MTNLMLVDRQTRKEVIESSIRRTHFHIHANPSHLVFLSKRLALRMLCRYTPPRYSRLIKCWTIHIHFGDKSTFPFWLHPHETRCSDLSRVFSWICDQLANNIAGIEALTVVVHWLYFPEDVRRIIRQSFQLSSHAAQLRKEAMVWEKCMKERRRSLMFCVAILATRVPKVRKMEVIGAEGLLGSQWRDDIPIYQAVFGRQVRCPAEEMWNDLHMRAEP